MNWDQIEDKWAAMTRRVRSDLPDAIRIAPDAKRSIPLTGDRTDTKRPESEAVSAR